jgi:hypothetical protein
MFGPQSRYRTVPDIAVPDAQGRVVAAKEARPLPEVTGPFRHIVTADDRLDQLAARYYGQPLLFWRICDANPELLSPLALVDAEQVVTARFPVTLTGTPPWAALRVALAGVVGVERVAVREEVTLVPRREQVDGRTVVVMVEHFVRAVEVTFNRVNVTAGTLADRIRAAGFQAGPATEIGQLGQEIIIPPAAIG